VLFTVPRLPPEACRRRQAITVAAFLDVKMAVPIDFETQKGYYLNFNFLFSLSCRRRHTDDE